MKTKSGEECAPSWTWHQPETRKAVKAGDARPCTKEEEGPDPEIVVEARRQGKIPQTPPAL